MSTLSETLLFAGGIFNIGFAIFHLFFWKIFDWKEDLATLTSVNRAIMQTLNLCLTLVFLIMAYISIFHRAEMLSTNLGKTLLISFSIFWFLRMIEQVVFFKIKRLVSFAFALIFLAGGMFYLLSAMMK